MKADPKAIDGDGNSVLYRELLKAQPDTDVVGGCLSAGADANLLNKAQQAALHILLSNKSLQQNGWFVAHLLNHGAKPDDKAFALARSSGDAKAVELMQAEADFFAALKNGDAYAAASVVKRGSLNQDARFAQDEAFLHMSLKAGVSFIPVVKELLWHGANPATVNGQGDNALHIVLRSKSSHEVGELISLLIDWGRCRGGIVDNKAVQLGTQHKHGELLSVDEKEDRHRAAALNEPEK